jgi:hypothetical protein
MLIQKFKSFFGSKQPEDKPIVIRVNSFAELLLLHTSPQYNKASTFFMIADGDQTCPSTINVIITAEMIERLEYHTAYHKNLYDVVELLAKAEQRTTKIQNIIND